ncbi:hypothetical protein P7K49_032834 [Saguinus oedipus]|uniref:Uncharacterized protein n=1 Tax=Saguinus oedipus TaxID=9490 RepID=A0ABQ9TQ68_SAGOE|nr:hypothetical protein P7K49_032834 [Saguinus oedipus]
MKAQERRQEPGRVQRPGAHLFHQEADVVALDGAAVHGGAGVHSLHNCNRAGGSGSPHTAQVQPRPQCRSRLPRLPWATCPGGCRSRMWPLGGLGCEQQPPNQLPGLGATSHPESQRMRPQAQLQQEEMATADANPVQSISSSLSLPEKWWWKQIFARRFWKDSRMPSTLTELMLRSPDSSNLAKASL